MTIGDTVRKFLQAKGAREAILEHELKGLLNALGMAAPRGFFVPHGQSASVPSGISFPLAAKVESSGISSKSDIGGVRLGIADDGELRKAMSELSAMEHSEGVLVEEMASPGFEVIVGGAIDTVFGPVVMFGLGGLFVELFRDVSFALAPVDRGQALWLMGEIRGAKVLKGFRGRPPLDMDAMADIIVTVSEIIATGLFRTIDLNPVSLYPEGALVLDAKMTRI